MNHAQINQAVILIFIKFQVGEDFALQDGDDLTIVAFAGANIFGACMLCVAGTYQTGSGQIHW
jgi:hypothetical protein